jgi:hypothetical protein
MLRGVYEGSRLCDENSRTTGMRDGSQGNQHGKTRPITFDTLFQRSMNTAYTYRPKSFGY